MIHTIGMSHMLQTGLQTASDVLTGSVCDIELTLGHPTHEGLYLAVREQNKGFAPSRDCHSWVIWTVRNLACQHTNVPDTHPRCESRKDTTNSTIPLHPRSSQGKAD